MQGKLKSKSINKLTDTTFCFFKLQLYFSEKKRVLQIDFKEDSKNVFT